VTEAIYPHIGTADRSCFVCAWSTTNPAIREIGGFWKARATPRGPLTCKRFGSRGMMGFEICGAFQHRAEFPGWPTLPWVRPLGEAVEGPKPITPV
jgi:hypothetical protein